MSVEVAVFCDGCSAHGDAGKSAFATREQLRAFGWRTALPGGRDLCPDCAEKEADDAAS